MNIDAVGASSQYKGNAKEVSGGSTVRPEGQEDPRIREARIRRGIGDIVQGVARRAVVSEGSVRISANISDGQISVEAESDQLSEGSLQSIRLRVADYLRAQAVLTEQNPSYQIRVIIVPGI
ncbi:MAG: hypothetical protein WCT39_03085 [Candidatus Margulisiibacteriota bacterium]